MKKTFTAFSLLIATLVVLQSCKKNEDKEDPLVTLNGDAAIVLDSGVYVEYGATAHDNEDGELVPVISNALNINTIGTYKITYSAYDNSGNKGSALRTVKVNQFAQVFAGTYQMHREEVDSLGAVIATLDYAQILTPSTIYNKYATFSKFLNVNFSPSTFKIFGMLDRKSKKIVILPPLSSNLKTGTTFSVTGSEKTLDAHKIDGIGTIVNDSLLNFSFTDSIARTIINLTLPPANDTVNVKLVKRYNVSMTR